MREKREYETNGKNGKNRMSSVCSALSLWPDRKPSTFNPGSTYRRFFASFALFVLFVSLAPALALALDPHKAITQYRHDRWRVENGLPQNSIYAVAQTPDGYLWLGTSGGLVRFDGVRFTIFDSSNTAAIKRNTISRLFADREGNLWIDTLSGGVIRYRNGQFMPVTVEEGLPRGVVTAWCEDRAGRFWIASLPGGLMQWRGDRFVQMQAEAYSERIVRSPVLTMTFDRQGALWLGTREAGLWRLRDGQLTAFTMNDGLPDYKVNCLYSDRN